MSIRLSLPAREMASIVANYFERLRSRQVVRPWALAAPVVVLAIALPLLRPLRSPALASQTELSYLATIQAPDAGVILFTVTSPAIKKEGLLLAVGVPA